MTSFLALALAALVAAEVKPQFKDVKIVANVTNPNLDRDSCGSVKMGNRAFWTCRDTQYRMPGNDTWSLPFTNSAGWTDYNDDGSPKIQKGAPIGPGSTGDNNVLLMTGPYPKFPLFYPVGIDMCPDSGVCENGLRWANWPDTPPVVTNTDADGTITSYAFVAKSVLQGYVGINKQPPTSLFKLTYKPTDDPNVLPEVSVVDYDFWAEHEVGFGVYGNVVRNNYLYLYGKAADEVSVMLARVPVFLVEQKFFYEYYVGGMWTRDKPAMDNAAAVIPNASLGGQGTYYWSDRYNSYFWIGQVFFDINADFYITSAPNPEGPWVAPYLLWKGEPNGNQDLHSYTLQAHPHMVNPDKEDGIYVSWTQNDDVYITPLAFISFDYIF